MSKKLKCWRKSKGDSKIAERYDRVDGKGYILLSSRDNDHSGKRPKPKPNAKWDTFAMKNNVVQLTGSKNLKNKESALNFAKSYMKKHNVC